MNYRDQYPSCAECPFLQLQQALRDATSKDIQDSELLIASKQAMLDHYTDMTTNLNVYTLLLVMAAKERGMSDERIASLLDSIDEYDRHIAEITTFTKDRIAAAHAYIETSIRIVELTDTISQKIAKDCPGFSLVRYLGQKGCKSALIPFVDNQNK